MKRILLLIAITVTTLSVSAQDFKEGFSYGAKAGLNIAKLTDAEGSIIRTHVGAVASYRFSYFLGVQAELLYSLGGTDIKFKMPEDGFNDNVHLNLNYISIPVLAKFYLAGGLNLEAGIQADFMVRSKINYHGDKIDSPLEANSVSMTIPIGLSYDFRNGITAGIRYNLGMSDVFKDDSDKMKNRIIMISAGYMF